MRDARPLGQALRQRRGLGLQLGIRHDAAGEPEAQRLGRGDHVAQQEQLLRLRRADEAAQEIGAAEIGAEAHLHEGRGEARAFRGDPQVAGQRQRQARPGRNAVYRADRDLRHLRQDAGDLGVAAEHRGALGQRDLAATGHGLHVAAGTEAAARAGQDHGADAAVLRDAGQAVAQMRRHFGDGGVQPLRPVQRQRHDGAVAAFQDGIGHAGNPRGEGMKSGRGLYSHDELRRLLNPRSIAVIGASTRAGSFGLRTIRNLAGFDGAIYPVNARYEAVEGHRCYADLASLPEAPDCAVIALNRDAVEETIAPACARGVGGIVLYASGYAETRQPELIELQDRLLRLVEGTKTRLIGPNCLGINNYAIGARIMFGRMPAPRPLRHGAIGIVTQSGSVGMSLAQAMERGVPVSHSIPVGNGADVGIADLIAYLAADEHCHAIVTVFEGVDDPRQPRRAPPNSPRPQTSRC